MELIETIPCNHHLPDLLSVTIQRRERHSTVLCVLVRSTVFRHVRSTQKEQYQLPQSGSGALGFVAEKKRRGSCRAHGPA